MVIWLSRKNLTIAELDFLIHPSGYTYNREWFDDELLLVTFVSKGFYKGSFVVDKNFNLIQLNYVTQEPYPFFYTSEESIGKNHKFTSNWMYQKEKVTIRFEIIKDRMVLKHLIIEEKLSNFTFKRYNTEGVTFTDVNNFSTQIQLDKN